MEHWQFLIQKQGDRTWQSLESPTLKIVAGKYRVLARSHFVNTDVEVRVIHSSIEEIPPKQRILKRSRRTNADGLLAVIPFTELKAGIWELRCSADLMSQMLGKSWQYSLVLNVSSSELNQQQLLLASSEFDQNLELTSEEEEYNAILASEFDTNTLLTEAIEDVNQPVSPVLIKGETAEQILQNVIDLVVPSSESWEENPVAEEISPLSPPLPLQLSLEKDTYIARWGKTLTVNGNVELVETIEIDKLENKILDEIVPATYVYQLQIVTELRSPSESEILSQVTQPLTNQILPFTFSHTIEIPTECQSKLILANINLSGTFNNDIAATLLASHSFIITADVTELLTITAPKSSTSDLLVDDKSPENEDAQKQKSAPVSVALELFNLAKTPKLAQFHILKPADKKPLPPRIKPVVVVDGNSPELPKLPRIHKNAMSGLDLVIPDDSELTEPTISNPIPPINLQKLVIKQVRTSFPYLRRLSSTPEPEQKTQIQLPNTLENQLSQPEPENTQPIPAVELLENVVPLVPILNTDELITPEIANQIPQTPSLIQQWMESQGYFLPEEIELVNQENNSDESTQETSLTLQQENAAVEPELPVNLDAEIQNIPDLAENVNTEINQPIPEEIPEPTPEPIPEPIPEPEPSANLASILSEEIVLDDVYLDLNNQNSNQSSESQQPQLDLSPPTFLNLPTPQIFLPNSELLAGSAVKLRLEMSAASSTVVLKLWVEDYQTRALLDGPHLLRDLRYTPGENWEATIQLIIPFGCVEILIGAIALDVNTEQESHKVTVVKTVIPPDLSVIEIDELLDI